MKNILIAGVSTRAAAESAARAGFDVTALDAFADLDQHPRVRALSATREFGRPLNAKVAAQASRTLDYDGIAYLSNVDNHPRSVERLAAGRALLGNDPGVLRRVRNPRLLTDALRRHGCVVPDVLAGRELRDVLRATQERDSAPASSSPAGCDGPRAKRELATQSILEKRWLVKPLRSGGGHHVRQWEPGMAVPRNAYLQASVEGAAASIVFASARGHVVPIGLSSQLVGEASFGSAGYRYCGSILTAARDEPFTDDRTIDALCALARIVAADFDLVGVNGIDVIVRQGVPWAIEVNPRWSASMELVERAYGLSVFAAHAHACTIGMLPDFELRRAREQARTWGKAIVFARHDVVCGDTTRWLGCGDIRDVPHPGEVIRAGSPVCTVFAEAADATGCRAGLVAAADGVYAQLLRWSEALTIR